MKLKSMLIALSAIIPFIGFAQNPPNQMPQVEPGIKIVPVSQINLSKELQKKEAIQQKSLLAKGYIEVDSQDARELLKLKNNDYNFSSKNENDLYGSDLKKDLSHIKLAFPFNGIKGVSSSDIIGFAIAGTYQNGWTGVAEYFNDNNLGTCHYLINNVAITKGGIWLRDDLVRYDINKKPTNVAIEGNRNSGFLYSIKWYDNTFFHTLTCANSQYDKKIMTKMITFARSIDSDGM